MICCACYFIPVWASHIVIHPVWMASLRANKMAHVCREASVDTSPSLRIPGGQVVTVSCRPKGRDTAQTHTHTHTLTHTYTRRQREGDTLGPPHPLLSSRHKPCPPCIAAHPYVTHFSLLCTPPCFHPCSSAMGITSFTCLASIRRHARACQPHQGGPHLQVIRPRWGNTGERGVSTAVCLPPIPTSACLMSPPRPHRYLSLLLRALYFGLGSLAVCLVLGPDIGTWLTEF